MEFFPAGSQILPQGEQPQGRIRVVRRGSVELLNRGRPVDLLGEGEMFGHPSVLSGEPTRYEVRAREDTLTYALPAEDVVPLLGRPSSLRFLARSLLARGGRAGGNGTAPPVPEVSMQPAAALVGRPPVIVRPETTLRDAARRMNVEEVSSVLVELEDGQYGIVTDRDLRSEVVAGRRTSDDPVTAAMSTPLVGVSAEETGADVMLTMLDHNIRHVVVFSPRSEVLGRDRRDRPGGRRDALAVRPAPGHREGSQQARVAGGGGRASLDGDRASSRRARAHPDQRGDLRRHGCADRPSD